MRIAGLEKCVVRVRVERPDGTALMVVALPTVNGMWSWESADATQLLRLTCTLEDKLLDLAERAGVAEDLRMADADVGLLR